MHQASYNAMTEALAGLELADALVLDAGSLDVNGTYRPLVEDRGWGYVGADIVPGPNVDIMVEPFSYPFADRTFDVVISGSTMEHVTAIWRWMPELARILKLGGLLAIITHWNFNEHRYPVDCWRVLPDGMRYLFDLTGILERYDIRIINRTDIVGIAFRR